MMFCQKCVFILPIVVAAIAIEVMGGPLHGPAEDIIGGVPTRLAEFPYQVSLQKYNSHYCGGAIISRSHILTAAHCLENNSAPYYDLTVLTGTTSLSNGGNRHRIKNVVKHPNYFRTETLSPKNDIGIIILSAEIIFDSYQQPIQLQNHVIYHGSLAVVAGWGYFEPGNNKISENLQKFVTALTGSGYCQQFVDFATLNDKQICGFAQNGTGSCHGDSGGPLVVNSEVVGIVSFGDTCAFGYPTIYTAVAYYKDFIIQTMLEN